MTQAILLAGEVSLQAAGNEKPARVEILAYTGGIVWPNGLGPHVIDLAGLKLPDSVPLLVDHENRLDAIAGSGKPSIRAGQVVVKGTLARSTESAQRIIGLSQAGVQLGASVGVEREKIEHVRAGQQVQVNGQTITAPREGLTVCRVGTLREVSFTPIPADSAAGVTSIAASRGNFMHTPISADEQTKIIARCENAPLKCGAAFQDRLSQVKERALVGELDALQFEREVAAIEASDGELHQLRASRTKAGTFNAGMRGDSSPSDARVITAALCLAGGLSSPEKHFAEPVLDAADRMTRNVGLQSLLMRAACENGYQAGHAEYISQGNLRRVLQAAFSPDLRASGWSTLSIPNILSNVANKFLLDGWQETSGDEWRKISDIKSCRDFKQQSFYRLLESAEYEQVGSGGEIKHGTLGEQSMTVTAATYGRMYAITRTQIINDDLGALTDIPRRLGRAAGMKFRRIFWAAFLASDGFWDAANDNVLAGAGTALTVAGTALDSALTVFRAMRTSAADGRKLIGGKPAVLMVPPALEIIARRLLTSTGIVAGGDTAVGMVPSGNPFAGLAELVVVDWLSDSDLTGYSAAKWYLLRSPGVAPAMLVSFLNGQQSPTVETADADFNVLGIQMRGYHDWGVGRGEPLCGLQVAGEA